MLDTPSGRSRTGMLKGPDGRRKAPSPTNREKAAMTSTQRARRPGLFGRSASRIPIYTVQQSAETLQKGSPPQESRRHRTLYLA